MFRRVPNEHDRLGRQEDSERIQMLLGTVLGFDICSLSPAGTLGTVLQRSENDPHLDLTGLRKK
jgi:hypothetical protein